MCCCVFLSVLVFIMTWTEICTNIRIKFTCIFEVNSPIFSCFLSGKHRGDFPYGFVTKGWAVLFLILGEKLRKMAACWIPSPTVDRLSRLCVCIMCWRLFVVVDEVDICSVGVVPAIVCKNVTAHFNYLSCLQCSQQLLHFCLCVFVHCVCIQ